MVSVKVDLSGIRTMPADMAKQAKYAMALTLNRLGEEANARGRQYLPTVMHIRDTRMLDYVFPRQLPRPNRATRDNLRIVLETTGKGMILAPFEEGLPHVGTTTQPVAIPTDYLRPSPMSVIPRTMFPSNLGLTPKKDASGTSYYALGRGSKAKQLTPYKTSARGVVRILGRRGTFVLDPRLHRGVEENQWGVYIRLGPGKDQVRMIWRFIDEVPRPAILRYEEIVRQVVATRLDPMFQAAFLLALRDAFAGGRRPG